MIEESDEEQQIEEVRGNYVYIKNVRLEPEDLSNMILRRDFKVSVRRGAEQWAWENHGIMQDDELVRIDHIRIDDAEPVGGRIGLRAHKDALLLKALWREGAGRYYDFRRQLDRRQRQRTIPRGTKN